MTERDRAVLGDLCRFRVLTTDQVQRRHFPGEDRAVVVQYDADRLRTQVGGLSLARSAQTGLVTAVSLGSVAESLSYDGFGELLHYAASQSGSALYALDLSRDALGRITSKSETLVGATHVFSYTYDLAGRLTEVRQDGVVTDSEGYDANGNRTSVTGTTGMIAATYDAQDRLTQYGAATFTHTPNGERQSKAVGGQTTSYRYNSMGSLAGVTLPTGTQIDYVLDGNQRRAGKRVNGTLVQGLLYQDGLRPIAELDGAGNVISRFVYAGGHVPAYLTKGGATYRIVADQLGSPRLVVDVATGAVVQRLDYDTFGNVTLNTNPSFQPFGFAGGLYDRDTGLVHFGAREYDPETGRWTTKDPIGFTGGDTNLYAYAGSDPVNGIDVTGFGDFATDFGRLCVASRVACQEVAKAAGMAAGGGGAFAAAREYGGQALDALEGAGGSVVEAIEDALCASEKFAANNAGDGGGGGGGFGGGGLGGGGGIGGGGGMGGGGGRTPTIPGIGPAVFVTPRNPAVEYEALFEELGEGPPYSYSALQQYRALLGEFNALVYRLAGVYPGGPSVSIEKMDEAHRAAVRIYRFDPTLFILAGD